MKDEKVEAMREFILLLTKQVKDAQIEASIKTMLDKLIAEKMAEIEAAVLAQGEPSAKVVDKCKLENESSDETPRIIALRNYLEIGSLLYTHPAPVNQALLERITKLEQALDVALEALEKSMYPQKLQLDAIAKIKELK